MNAPIEACGPLELGVWIDDGPALVLERPYLDRLLALPLSHVAVMIDGPRPGMSDARWSTDELAKLAAALPRVERILSLWSHPSAAHVGGLLVELPALLEAFVSRVVELDLEPAGGWHARGVEGYVGLADAGRAVVENCRRAGAERVEITTFPAAIPRAAGAIAAADVLALQVYPVATRNGTPVPYGGRLGPLRYPAEALEAARRRFPGVELVCGLPAYKQAWPGHEPLEAMHAAIASAAGVGVKRARYWSAKWLVRKKKTVYAAPALEALGAVAVRT